MTTATHKRAVGEAHALVLYETDEGRRVLIGQRVDGVVRLVDRPLDPTGRRVDPTGRPFLVEARVSSRVELDAIVRDYAAQARRLGDCPMRAGVIDLLESSRRREAHS